MYVQFQAQPGERDALVEVLTEAARLVRALPDCLSYVVATEPADADAVCVMEEWTSEAAHRASLEREDVRAVIGRGRPLIAGVGAQVRMVPVRSVPECGRSWKQP